MAISQVWNGHTAAIPQKAEAGGLPDQCQPVYRMRPRFKYTYIKTEVGKICIGVHTYHPRSHHKETEVMGIRSSRPSSVTQRVQSGWDGAE